MKRIPQQHDMKRQEMMEKCFACYAENGLTGTGTQALAEACGCTKANLYVYFKNLDELIIDSTAYCMSKVEDDFLTMAPTDPKAVMRFLEEVPYWTAKKHGKKYRADCFYGTRKPSRQPFPEFHKSGACRKTYVIY